MSHRGGGRSGDNRSSRTHAHTYHQSNQQSLGSGLPQQQQQYNYSHSQASQQQQRNTISPYSRSQQTNISHNPTIKSHHHYHQSKRANQQYQNQRTKAKKLEFDGIEVEELNEYLGYPDLYQLETNAKYHDTGEVPELHFTKEYAKSGYYEVQYKKSKVHQYGTFVSTKTNDFLTFITNLKAHEAGLRGDWKTLSTKKIREDRKLLFENAMKACQCETPKVGFPELALSVHDDSIDQWMEELANRGARRIYISLRELASHVPQGIKMKSLIPMLSRYQVPFIRAVWLIKLLCLNHYKGKHSDLTQLWTDVIIGFLNEQTDSQSTTLFSEQCVIYLVRLICWCCEERIIDYSAVESWFISKCDDIISPNSSSRPIISRSARRNSSSSSSGSGSSFTSQNKTNFDLIFERSSELRNLYHQALNRCAELISQRTCPQQLKIVLFHIIKMLKKQSDPSKFFLNVHQVIDKECYRNNSYSNNNHNNTFSISSTRLHIIESLDKFARNGNLEKLYFELLKKRDLNIIPIICEWGYTSMRFGKYRRFIVTSILQRLLNENPDLALSVQQILLDILNSIKTLDEKTTRNLYYLYADFIRTGLFSLEQYLNSVISRGLLSTTNSTSQFHRDCVMHFPLDPSASNYLKTQRKIGLYGATFSSNEQSIHEDQQITYYSELLSQTLVTSSSIKPDSNNTVNTHNNSMTADSLKEILTTISCTLPIYAIFSISDRIFLLVKNIVEGMSTAIESETEYHLHSISEETIMRIVMIFAEIGDYRQLQDILKRMVDQNNLHGDKSVWAPYESLVCKVALNFLPLFVATDQSQFVSRTLLSQCKKDPKQSFIETRKRRVIEEYLKYLNSTYPEVFRFDGFKRDFPHLSMFLDGLSTTPASPAYNSTDMEDVAPISPTIQLVSSSVSGLFLDHLRHAMKQKEHFNSLETVSDILNSFLEKSHINLSSVIFASRKEIYPLLNYCLDHFDPERPYMISILREMMFSGCFFSNTELYDVLCHFAAEKFGNCLNNTASAKKIAIFLILCVSRDLVSYEILATGIMKSLFGQILRKLLASDSELSQTLLASAFATLWFARAVFADETSFTISKYPKLSNLLSQTPLNERNFVIEISELEQGAFALAKANFNVSQTPNIIKILGDFCNRTVQRQSGERLATVYAILSDTVMELYESFVSQDDIRLNIACRSGLLHRCFEAIYEKFPSAIWHDDDTNVSYRQVTIASLVYHMLQLVDSSCGEDTRKLYERYFTMPQPNAPIISLPSIGETIDFLKEAGGDKRWNFWHDAFFLNSFLFHMKRKTQVDSDHLNRSLYQPLMQSNGTSVQSQFKEIYSYVLLHLVKHFPKLKTAICDQFFAMLTKIYPQQSPVLPFQSTKEEHELWVQCVRNMSHIIIEISRSDIHTAEKCCYSLCESIRQLTRATSAIPIFISGQVSGSGLHGLQQRLIVCLNILNTLIFTCHLFNPIAKPRPSSTVRSAVIKSVLEASFQLMDHKLSQASFPSNHGSTSTQISDLLHSILNELQERVAELQPDEQHKIREQISNFCSQKLSVPLFTSKMTNILNYTASSKRIHPGETWSVLEDYIATCGTCGSIHGHVTPNIFNGRIQERKNHLYNANVTATVQGLTMRPDAFKRKRDQDILSNNPYSSPSPLSPPNRSPRNGVHTPTPSNSILTNPSMPTSATGANNSMGQPPRMDDSTKKFRSTTHPSRAGGMVGSEMSSYNK